MADFYDQQEKQPASEFDPDAFMQARRKPKPKVQTPPPAGDFETWLNERQGAKPAPTPTPQPQAAPGLPKPVQKQAPVRRTPGGPNDPFEASLQDQAVRERARREAERQKKRAEFAQKPWTERWSERATDALARSGPSLMNTATFLGGYPMALFTRPKRAMPKAVDEWQKERARELAERQANRPEGGLLTQAAEGLIEAAPQVGVAALTGGESKLMAPLAGGFMAAAQQNWLPVPRRGFVDASGKFYPAPAERVLPPGPRPKSLKYTAPVDIMRDGWQRLSSHPDFQRMSLAEQRAAVQYLAGVAQSDNPTEGQLHPDFVMAAVRRGKR